MPPAASFGEAKRAGARVEGSPGCDRDDGARCTAPPHPAPGTGWTAGDDDGPESSRKKSQSEASAPIGSEGLEGAEALPWFGMRPETCTIPQSPSAQPSVPVTSLSRRSGTGERAAPGGESPGSSPRCRTPRPAAAPRHRPAAQAALESPTAPYPTARRLTPARGASCEAGWRWGRTTPDRAAPARGRPRPG